MSSELAAALDRTPDRAAAQHALSRIETAWHETQLPLRDVLASFGGSLPALFHLLSISPVSVEKLVRDPAALIWLAAPEVCDADRGPVRMRAALREMGWVEPSATRTALKPKAFAPLRRWKQRELLRIALRDVGDTTTVEATTLELSHLAEVCIREITAAWHADLVRRLGDPGTGFCILGMGKLGAQELNFSSDIDVLFFYDEPGELASGLSRQEFFTRLAQSVIETFAAADHDGALFRIDVRLRPEGGGGPLVRTLDSMEHYYAAFGETWERMALSKARLVAGDEELAYEFFQRLQAFIYPRSVSPDMIEEVAHLKGRIERELLGPSRVHRDVKLGRGGIREIEFICQALQLLHGSRHAFLQERQTLKALHNLRELEFLQAQDATTLSAAYRYLRTVEHRLQIENEAQTHTLPKDKKSLRRLAHSLHRGQAGAQDETAFLATLARSMDGVRSVFERVMRSEERAPEPAADLSFFHDSTAAQKNFKDLGEGGGTALIAPRTKKLFARLEPHLHAQLRQVADPDGALTRLVRFAERYGSRNALFDTLLVNPRVLELFVKLFDASAFLSEIAIRRPQLVEEIARLGNLGQRIGLSNHLTNLLQNDEDLPWMEWVRVYRHAQQLRIGLRDLLGISPLQAVWEECSVLAEACLLFTARQLGVENDLTTIALGKFGGCELGYGADLDVLFIGSVPSSAAQLIRAMTESTAEGRLFPVDARLRPEGESGQLAIPLSAWVDYFARGRGELWEAQALTKARPLYGPDQATWLAVAQAVWREHGRRPDLMERIAAMSQRIAEHRGGDPMLDFKTGPGGIAHLEFYVQSLQMKLGHWEPNTLAALQRIAPPENVAPLTEAYFTLRKVETVLRRMDDTSISKLPENPAEQDRVAIRCGLPGSGDLLHSLARARETIHGLANFAK
jgi:glutamate-ammonia-ligase adenylyltransferase